MENNFRFHFLHLFQPLITSFLGEIDSSNKRNSIEESAILHIECVV